MGFRALAAYFYVTMPSQNLISTNLAYICTGTSVVCLFVGAGSANLSGMAGNTFLAWPQGLHSNFTDIVEISMFQCLHTF